MFPTADGELMIAAANDRLFGQLCAAIGRPELALDPRFRTNPDRLAHRDGAAPARPRADRAANLRGMAHGARGHPVSPVQNIAEAAQHEQTRASGMLQELDGSETLALPLQIDRERVTHAGAAPTLGAQSARGARELGYSESEIESLAAARVTRLT